jgi:hypothetical protein
MLMTTRKRVYTGRNTAMFYALISQLPGYDARYRDLIKEGVINDFLCGLSGGKHNRPLSLSGLTDGEYRELITDLRQMVNRGKGVIQLQQEAVRKRLIHQVLTTLSRIGVAAKDGDYSEVNYHIARLPISKGRLIYQFATDELPGLLAATRAYCGVMKKRQEKERALAFRN